MLTLQGTENQVFSHTEHSCESHTREVAGNKGLRTDRLNPFKFLFSASSLPFPRHSHQRPLPPPPLSPKCLTAVSQPSGPWTERVIPPLCCSQQSRIRPAVPFLPLAQSLSTKHLLGRGLLREVIPSWWFLLRLMLRCHFACPGVHKVPPCWKALVEWEKS